MKQRTAQASNPRFHGEPPYRVAVIHGGPGAPGEMAPVARELAAAFGVIEPLQTADSVSGQVVELGAILRQRAALPVVLVGYSWGAWLSFILAARQPTLVARLILISSGPFEEQYVQQIMATRLKRLNSADREAAQTALATLSELSGGDRDSALELLGELFARSDTFDPVAEEPGQDERLECRADVFSRVWSEAAELRKSGRLLAFGRDIRCPVTAIHGDYDPHPTAGVRDPLAAVLTDFRFHELRHCGHTPWRERQARDEFYRILRSELQREDPECTPCS